MKSKSSAFNPYGANPFGKDWEKALIYLFSDLHKKMLLTNYKPSLSDWALLTLKESRNFMNKINGRDNDD